MKTLKSLLALTLLAIALASPALAQDVATKTKTCKPGSTKGNCLLALITTLQAQVATLQTALAAVQNNHALALAPFVSVDASAENGVKGPNIVISGANVHIESGSGNTSDTTGLGNLIIGYDEDSLAASTIDPNRTGSHNLVVGMDHEFTASGGAVLGFGNFISSDEASITGGDCNAAGATAFPSSLSTPCFNGNAGIDSVSGGELNASNGSGSSISGGSDNTSSSQDASVSGGAFNTASAANSSVSGGVSNTANGEDASVSGGGGNTASALASSIQGGAGNTASGTDSSVSGGESNTASGQASSILGGNSVTVSTTDGHSP
jgi:hypothetical protein